MQEKYVKDLGISEQLIEALPDAVFVIVADGTIAIVNAQAERLFGYPRADLIGKTIEALVPDSVRTAHPAYRARYFQEPQVRPMGAGLALSGRRQDGSEFPAEISLSAIETPQGTLVTAVVRDVTERRKTQAKFEGLLEAAPDAMLGVDDRGVIRLVNTQSERLFGYAREELLGRRIEVLVPVRARGAHPAHREHYFADPQFRPMALDSDLSGLRKDGTEFPAEISLSSIETEDGILVTAAVRDATERKAFEKVVATARDTAERAARSRQEFLANMSHEIRTPMNAVIGMTSLLLDTGLSDEQRDYVETVRTSGDHLLTIINDILDYSKIDAGKLTLEEVPFLLRQWLEESLDLITAQANEKNLELVHDIDDAVPFGVVGDPGRLRQILINLLSNAVKFTDQGEISVAISRLEAPGCRLRIEVKDTGIGISPDRIESLFHPFTQADSTTTREYGGTGLGLAISRQLAELMGGSIGMVSQPGVGTTVSFTCEVQEAELTGPDVPVHLDGQRVLLVDDNPTNLRILEAWTKRVGMLPYSATSGAMALGIIEREAPFDVAIVDLMMPQMDGVELAGHLRRRLPGTKLVLLSSAGPHARAGSLASFDAVMSKPVKQSSLFDVLALLVQAPTGDTAQRPSKALPASAFTLETTHQLAILVVEDNPVNQKVARHLLNRFGFRADLASSGVEALEALERQGYDLILMDVQMPDMDGLEATRRIRLRWPVDGPQIIAMTANVSQDDIAGCLAAGMDGFLGKPIVVDQLAAVLSAPPRSRLESAIPTTPSVDESTFAKLCLQIGRDNVRELVDMFRADVDASLTLLLTHARNGERTSMAQLGHRLKSASRSLGATALSANLTRIETEAATLELASLSELVEASRAEFARVERRYLEILS